MVPCGGRKAVGFEKTLEMESLTYGYVLTLPLLRKSATSGLLRPGQSPGRRKMKEPATDRCVNCFVIFEKARAARIEP